MKEKKISLRLSIVSIYVITFVLLMLMLITTESWILSEFISIASTNLLKNTSDLVLQELQAKGTSAENLCKLSKVLLEKGIIDDHQIMNYSLYAAQNTTKFQLKTPSRKISWIEPQGNSISTFLEPDGTYSTVIYKPFEHPPIGQKLYRNHDLKIIKSEAVPPLDMRESTPWLLAIKTGHFTWTDAFFSMPEKNITTSAVAPVYNKSGQLAGVFTVNIAMEAVSDYLQKLTIGKNGLAFMINGKDQLIAFPGMNKKMYQKMGEDSLMPIHAINKPWVAAALLAYRKIQIPFFTFNYNNNRYIATFPLTHEDNPEVANYNWRVGVVVPEKDFTEYLDRKKTIIISLGILIVLSGIVIAYIFSKLLTTRIRMLVEETERIKKFHFKGKKVESFIKEVYLLSNAIHSMKINLRSFKKYVPANLVQQLIKSGQDIHLGGDAKTLSLLFSDIKNFTQISESLAPDQLMMYLSEYLDNLSTIISSQQGTIDKFIGDSIMAFWGAPLVDINHCQHACQTALLCRNKINQLNDKWIHQGKEPFITRFGVHTGEVIVGNLGSKERMNYTAIGDSVNLTSRLEGLNKIYGTSIIVSEKVVEQVRELFVFRKLDITAIKGKSGGHLIYELMVEKASELSFDIKDYIHLFDQGFTAYQHHHWTKAIALFKKALNIYPEDTVTRVFIMRCKQFMKRPPPKDWDGVWRET